MSAERVRCFVGWEWCSENEERERKRKVKSTRKFKKDVLKNLRRQPMTNLGGLCVVMRICLSLLPVLLILDG